MKGTEIREHTTTHKVHLEEYLKTCGSEKAERAYAWITAIGLQDVDKLSTSDYLLNIAIENIEGNITMEEAKQRIDEYYNSKNLIILSALRTPERTYLSGHDIRMELIVWTAL